MKLFADVSDAVQKTIATYDQFTGSRPPSAGLVGAPAPDGIHHQAAVLRNWKP